MTGGNQERFGYDANGNMLYKVSGASAPLSDQDSTFYEYDNRNREVKRTFKSGHSVISKYTADGKRDTVIDYRGITANSYDPVSGLLRRVDNPDATWLEYAYDANRNKIASGTPWKSTYYTYDTLNRMKSVISGNDTTRYFYNAVGNRDSVSNAAGTGTAYLYDDLNRLQTVTNYTTNNSVQSSFEYSLNNAGMRTGVIESDASQVLYAYDSLYRLTGETRTGVHPYAISYVYDHVGNRLEQVKDGVRTTYTYNNRDQLLSESSSLNNISYTYDVSGRMHTKTENAGVTIYSWIDEDRLATITTPNSIIRYAYDADNSRIRTNTGTEAKYYLIDKSLPYGQVVAEYDTTGSLKCDYVYGLERISQSRNNVVHYYVADGQGAIRGLTDTAGNVTDVYYYTAFGEELAKSGTTENEFRYVGEQWDPNAGFYYLRARWMDPSTGRFVSVDPFGGDPQAPVTLHSYLYCGLNPINNFDPAGEQFNLQSMMLTVAIYGNLIAQSAQRLVPWLTKGSRFTPTLPYLQRLANAPVLGPTVQVVAKLTQSPQTSRTLSCAIGENAEALANAARTTGTLYRANIPKELFDALTNIGWAQKSTTLMGEVVGTEIEFSARAMELIFKFFH